MNDVSGNVGSGAQPINILAEQINNSNFANFGYADFLALFWGGMLNGFLIGALVALVSVTICKLMDVARNDQEKGD